MKIGEAFNINGETIRDNNQYRLIDNRELKNLVVSQTHLYPSMSTNGHAHAGVEEVYVFTWGGGLMEVGDATIQVHTGSVVVIPDGLFHRVHAGLSGLKFLAIFQKYER